MKIELTEAQWLDERRELSLAELAELSGLPEAELRELADVGIIAPVDPDAARPIFRMTCLVTARTACRLRTDFELDAPGLALALTLLDRIQNLEARLRELSAQRPRRSRRTS